MTRLEKMLDKAKELEWEVTKYEYPEVIDYCFSKFSSVGQDYNVSIDRVEDADDLLNKLQDYVNDYDISYEAYIWLDDTGHGKNGAPYEMIDVYKDMEECLEMTKELLYELEKI